MTLSQTRIAVTCRSTSPILLPEAVLIRVGAHGVHAGWAISTSIVTPLKPKLQIVGSVHPMASCTLSKANGTASRYRAWACLTSPLQTVSNINAA